MKRLKIYQNGERFITDNMTLSLHGQDPVQEYDLSEATDTEWEQIKENPHNDVLITTIQNRKKAVR